ncbi:hypothetical protein BJY01DRAFT_231437 [Aspergillus pseudoustus]|uniref:Methyltransferase domain-containing protein n=1 Tax=Aspergillus pseudoustus TaxID=1810923 RepID=A0ABR4KUT0_9EURO
MPRSTRTTGGRHSEQNREYDTQSLTESVTQYPIENGRTYHKYHEGSYVYPNDEREMDRLDMQHHMCKLLTGGRLFLSPLRNPGNIVDIGTGSGIWPIELASIFPQAQITGTDLSPCQPDEVPENVHFIVDDCTEEDWLWSRNSLDYIHSGHMSGALPSYKDLLRKMFDHLKPGGWAECQEFDTMVKCDDGTMPPLTDELGAYPLQDWCDLQIRAGQSTDPPRQFRVAHRIARGMRDVGFVDVQEYIFKAPVNPWSSDPHLHTIGKWNEGNILEALSGWSWKPLTTLSWSKPEIEVFLVQVRQSVQDRRVHAYFNFHMKCAYRHAIRPTSTATTNHVWISDELLASTFQRFTSGQRRHESRVPGPLEARRRLAKRRNTALASVAGSGILDDAACLFGRNGREHMKWTSAYQFSSPNALAPQEDLYDQDVGAYESQNPVYNPLNVPNASGEVPDMSSVEEQLRQCQTVSELRYAARELDLDLRRQPEYSRLMFDHLLSRFVLHQTAVHELLLFLDDRNLNIPGAGNYLGVVEHHVSIGVVWNKKDPLFLAVIRGLELGLVPATEIRHIVERLSNIDTSQQEIRSSRRKLYRSMWDAIGRCGIYGHQDLDPAILDSWLGAILESGTHSDYRLARAILLGAGDAVSNPSSWLQRFISRWLVLTVETHDGGDFVAKFLAPFSVDLVAQTLISVTKDLVATGKPHLLLIWMDWLPKVENVSDIVSSHVWADVRVNHSSTSYLAPMSPRHQILQRLWVLHTICMNHSKLRAGRHPTIKTLYRLFDMARRDRFDDLWSVFIKGVHDLKLPWKDLRSSVYYMRGCETREVSLSKASTRSLRRFEATPLSSAEIFEKLNAAGAAHHAFFHTMEKMICRIDITSPAFLRYALLIIQSGDTYKIWTVIRILRSHRPLKVAISRSWHRLDPADMALIRYYPRPRSSFDPDPHDCLKVIHALATAFATCEKLRPRRSFRLVFWLYVYCRQHGAPVRPKLVRALYHSGIVRYRRQGWRVATGQYNFIWDLVQRVESPEMVNGMLEHKGS